MTRVVFLGGLGRSGTTLLERMLGELPGVNAAGELVHLWQRGVLDNERCGCGEPFGDCAFWQRVGATAFGGWDRLDAGRVIALQRAVDRSRRIPALVAGRALAPGLTSAVREYVSYYDRLYDAILRVSGASVVIDSSKHASMAFCLRHAASVDLRVLHVVRDSRGVAYSWTKQQARPDSVGVQTFMPRYSPIRSVGLWNAHNVSLHVLARLGTPTRLLRYEDVIARPRTMLSEIAEFVGADPGGGALPFLSEDESTVDLHATHTVSGNPMRFRTGPVVLRRDDAWRSELPARDRRLVSALTIPLLAAYGYLPAGEPHTRAARPATSPTERPS